MPQKPTVEFKNMNRDSRGYFVGYLKGKRKKYVEQTERYATPEAAIAALVEQWQAAKIDAYVLNQLKQAS